MDKIPVIVTEGFLLSNLKSLFENTEDVNIEIQNYIKKLIKTYIKRTINSCLTDQITNNIIPDTKFWETIQTIYDDHNDLI